MYNLRVSWNIGSHSSSVFVIRAKKWSDAAKYVLSRPMNPNPASARTFNQAEEWLNRCDEAHEGCARDPKWLSPSRLLNVATLTIGEPVRLTETVARYNIPHDYKYAALSYCWGNQGAPWSTVKANIDEYKKGIPLETLPQTIHHAIYVTLSLGLSYLWIDCLCIVQDSIPDKTREIGQMPRVYKGAYVTIAAAVAANPHEGFLHPHTEPELLTDQQIKLPFRGPRKRSRFPGSRDRDRTSSVIITPVKPGHSAHAPHADPIHARAWTFQEFLLSRRTIVYSASQVRFVCRQGQLVDGGRRTAAIATPTPLGAANDKDDPIKWRWDDIVEQYSTRQLGNPEDKLTALAGVAEEFSAYVPDSGAYLAGMWEKNLRPNLLWIPDEKAVRPVCKYRAPSWSWASLDGAVTRFSYEYPDHDHYEAGAVILSATCTPLYEGIPFGPVSSGSLKVRARWQKAYFAFSQQPFHFYRSHSCGTLIKVRFDPSFSDEGYPEKVTCMVIGSTSLHGGRHYFGLVLEYLGASYRRLGVWDFILPDGVPDEETLYPLEEREQWIHRCWQLEMEII
ncbi:HET-domain-containing protein [Trichodelitschia bisporula]|uniref:HET-domain-containing protein n=1 Tax=Trichodelitschia bisporula TaxID=703511 RepID=A0A6G1HIP2_9PEZI|nr:HET-domain-containing protein [Trichodelitschia bisporula]